MLVVRQRVSGLRVASAIKDVPVGFFPFSVRRWSQARAKSSSQATGHGGSRRYRL
jgi:hypothetical protein